MSEEKDRQQNEKKEAGPSGIQEEPLPSNEDKKLKRSLRFQLPEGVHSEESFTSALSYNLIDNDNDDEDDNDYEDFTQRGKSVVSVFKKYVFTLLPHTSPRSAIQKHCFRPLIEEEQKFVALRSSSSRQLCEILKDSPTPSEADINLLNATYLRKLAAVKEAINNGANVNASIDKETSLLIATEIGDAHLVAYLLTVPDIDIDVQNDFGQTPLTVAIRNAFDRIVRLLLINNADVNLADNMGRTPLHGAVFQKRVGLVKLLLAYGADFEKSDCFEEKPMYTAAVKKPHLKCLLTLLKMGACPEYSNITGISLLSRTILNGMDNRIIEALVHYGASVNSRDFVSGKTPLHYAAIANNIKVAKFLISKGADVNIKTTYNFNAFEEAMFHGSLDVIEFLADKTKNLKVKNLASIKLEPSLLKRRELIGIREPEKKKKKKKKKK